MLELFAICTALVVGLGCGWWLRGAAPHYLRILTQAEDAARARETLDRLRNLTHDVASDVDKHKALMGRINNQLNSAGRLCPTSVARAVERLIECNERIQKQLDSAEDKLQDQARQIASHSAEAQTDPLTGLANRRVFDKELERVHRACADRTTSALVMILDIDHFKNLNDTYGHQAGDKVLLGIAQVLRDCIPDHHTVARYGGEEFAVIFLGRDIDEAREISERARRGIGTEKYDFDGLQLHVTASSGVAQLLPGETTSSLVGRADDALYVSKNKGRDSAHFHDGTTILPLQSRPKPAGEPPRHETPKPSYETGISSPATFSADLRRRISEWKSGGAPLCVLFVQIDNLNTLRQRCDDDNCTAIRRALTLTLKAIMREIDHAARFEGDALSLLLPGATLPGAVAVAERLRSAAARCELPSRYKRQHFTVSICVGQVQADENEANLIERVRDSLTSAHVHGQDCTYVHDGLDPFLVGVGGVGVST